MNNSNYDSLKDKLMQKGILPQESEQANKNDLELLFEIEPNEDMSNSPFVQQPIEIPKALQKMHKRLNQSDYEMVSNLTDPEMASFGTFRLVRRFLNIKQNLASKGALSTIENFLFAFFPRLYKAKLARDAMTKLKELNIDTNKLLDKTIPYGESETRYQSLIKYISYANEIQTKLKKKIN
ncbi:hypothetical protein IJ425_04500 [bacterium]|nr:hypothetical protein [bacterium]